MDFESISLTTRTRCHVASLATRLLPFSVPHCSKFVSQRMKCSCRGRPRCGRRTHHRLFCAGSSRMARQQRLFLKTQTQRIGTCSIVPRCFTTHRVAKKSNNNNVETQPSVVCSHVHMRYCIAKAARDGHGVCENVFGCQARHHEVNTLSKYLFINASSQQPFWYSRGLCGIISGVFFKMFRHSLQTIDHQSCIACGPKVSHCVQHPYDDSYENDVRQVREHESARSVVFQLASWLGMSRTHM